MSNPISLKDFKVHLGSRHLFTIPAFTIPSGSSTVVMGATGSGKSVLLKAMAGLLPLGPFTLGGDISFFDVKAYTDGKKSPFGDWRKIRKHGLAFIPAETAQAMNPALSLSQNLGVIAPDARALVEKRLAEYFSLDFKKYASLYPDEVSGGELQRITLMILLSQPSKVVFLDEPTVNLDRQLRKRFIEFLNREILGQPEKTVFMVSHDLDFVRELKISHYYLLQGSELKPLEALPEIPAIEKPDMDDLGAATLTIHELDQHYRVRGVIGEHDFWAFRDLNINFVPGHIYGITGPSGCGKTSMIKAILRLLDASKGTIEYQGADLLALKPTERGYDPQGFKPYRKKFAIVQQDSRYSFFPDIKIRDSLREIHRVSHGDSPLDLDAVASLMDLIKLPRAILDAYPRSLSSGEMKRMDIVRVLASRPEVVLLDEPFAHIDFETRSTVMEHIATYVRDQKAILLVVTHEDFDLRNFVQTDYDFLSMLGAS